MNHIKNLRFLKIKLLEERKILDQKISSINYAIALEVESEEIFYRQKPVIIRDQIEGIR